MDQIVPPRDDTQDEELIPHAFLMPRSRKVGVWRVDFEDLGLWAWRCANCSCVGHGHGQHEAVKKGLAHLDSGCRRPRLKSVG